MQSELIKELFDAMDSRLFTLMVQLIISGAFVMWVKDITTKTLNYIKVKFSDFGRGTKLEIDGKTGYLMSVGFNEVELEIDDHTTMIIPVEKFVKTNKIIIRSKNGNH